MDVRGHLPLEELVRLERVEKDAARSKRLRIVILAIGGYTAPAIAMSVGLSRRICQRWVARYNDEGLEGLDDRRGQEPEPTLTPEQEAASLSAARGGADGPRTKSVRSAASMCSGFWPRSSACSVRCPPCIICCIAWATRTCGRDLVIGEPIPRPRKTLRPNLPARLQALREAHPGKQLRVYFQDESRFGQQGTTTNVWARRGSRPTAVRQTEYQYLWVLGAVCAETGHAEGLLSPQLNTKIVNLFLEQFSQTLGPDEHAAMIWDGAGFHVSEQLNVPANVTIIQLPPYSPELNPIENLWHYLKSHFWSNSMSSGRPSPSLSCVRLAKKIGRVRSVFSPVGPPTPKSSATSPLTGSNRTKWNGTSGGNVKSKPPSAPLIRFTAAEIWTSPVSIPT